MSNSTTSTIKLRYFRENSQEIIDAVKKGKNFLVFKRSEPVLKISAPDIDEWGEEIGPNDVSIDFRKDDITVEEFMDALRKSLDTKKKHER